MKHPTDGGNGADEQSKTIRRGVHREIPTKIKVLWRSGVWRQRLQLRIVLLVPPLRAEQSKTELKINVCPLLGIRRAPETFLF